MISVRERINPPAIDYSQEVLGFSESINVPTILGKILVDRGVDTFDKAKEYFRPSLEQLHDPFLMPDMEKAADRICMAINDKAPIALYGDYDVDGISSCALVHNSLTALGATIKTYLPNRLEEGYGLSTEGVKEIAASGAKLILTVDCGITACAEVEEAAANGIEVIITDHHEAGSVLPQAYALLDPKVPGNPYPEKELAGVGVAFKLVQAVYNRMGRPEEDAHEFLDLVALGSAADIVPILGENRILVRFGFEKMKTTSNIGLKELIRSAGLYGKEIKTNSIVFGLAPMINAVGRLGNPERGFQLLISDSQGQAGSIVQLLRMDNEKRKDVDKKVTEEAIKMAEETVDFDNDHVIVLASETWHSGVIGIVASRLVERFYRPCVLISIEEDGLGKGSARTIRDFHLFNALSSCSNHLVKFGGHQFAAGLSIRKESIDDFRADINRVAAKELAGNPLVPIINPCGLLRLGDIDARFIQLLKLLEPYGPGNPRPVFYSDTLRLVGKPAVVGGNHLKFSVTQDGATFDAIAFGMADRRDDLDMSFNNFGLAFGLDENEWNGVKRIQLKIKGIDL